MNHSHLRNARLFAFTVFAGLTGLLTSCSTLNVQKDEVAKIQKVAIVGFSVIQDVPKTPMLGFGSHHKGFGGGMNGALCENTQHPQLIEKSLMSHLEKDMKWKIVESTKVYQSPVIERTLTWQRSTGRPLQFIPDNTKCYTDENVPEAFAFERRTMAERQELMRDLGVDAVIVAQVRVELIDHSMMSVVGGADYKPRSTLNFAVYNGEQEKPIWRDTWAQGEAEEKGAVTWFGVTNGDKLTAKIVSSSDSAFNQLFKKYNEKQ